MSEFKIGDEVVAINDCVAHYFKKGEIGIVRGFDGRFIDVLFKKYEEIAPAEEHEIEKIKRKFKVGDPVATYGKNGSVATITEIVNQGYKITYKSGTESMHIWYDGELTKIGGFTMYEDLKQRIEGLDEEDSFKEIDNILTDILIDCDSGYAYSLSLVHYGGNRNVGAYRLYKGIEDKPLKECEFDKATCKIQSLKNILLWLLDHSDIKKDLSGQEFEVEIEGEMHRVKVIRKV